MAFCFSALAAGDLVIADFNTGEKPNQLGGDFGAWDKDPADETQKAEMSFTGDDALGEPGGYAVRINYDVDSPNPAYNGFWMKLNSLDAAPFNTLYFYLRGDENAGYPQRVKIELKDDSLKASPYIVTGITSEWQKFPVPFEKFRRVGNWSSLQEFVIVFDDVNSSAKTGTVYLDQVGLSRE